MGDYEQYGDYNEIDEDKPGRRRPVLRLLRWLVTLSLFLFCGFLLFRMIVAEYYPRDLRSFRMTPALTAYAETHDLATEKVKIDVPYDDNTRASFIADNLVIERNAGAVQFTLRLSKYTMTRLSETLGEDVGTKPDESRFIVRLLDNLGNRYEKTDQLGRSYLWYRVVRVCFDGVNFDGVAWIRADVYLLSDPDASEPYASIPVLDFSGGDATES
ncbi:MAG: hypothetical protein J5958_05240 [Clostridia bacterium]|nr:hypothetical protein [Clostridia bacterium]